MRIFYVLSLLVVAGAIFLGMVAQDNWDAAKATRARNDRMVAELKQRNEEVQRLEGLEPAPLRFADDALAEFFTRTVEAGEVLGAGVRVQPRNEVSGRSMTFTEHRQGVKMCQVTLQAGLEVQGAAPILAMFEEELADLPVTVRKITARNQRDTIALTMEVDVFGR
jgi:hypothetical protein